MEILKIVYLIIGFIFGVKAVKEVKNDFEDGGGMGGFESGFAALLFAPVTIIMYVLAWPVFVFWKPEK